MVDVGDDGDSALAGRIALLGVDEVGDLEVEGEIGLEVLGAAGLLDVSLELGGAWVSHGAKAVSGRHSR